MIFCCSYACNRPAASNSWECCFASKPSSLLMSSQISVRSATSASISRLFCSVDLFSLKHWWLERSREKQRVTFYRCAWLRTPPACSAVRCKKAATPSRRMLSSSCSSMLWADMVRWPSSWSEQRKRDKEIAVKGRRVNEGNKKKKKKKKKECWREVRGFEDFPPTTRLAFIS